MGDYSRFSNGRGGLDYDKARGFMQGEMEFKVQRGRSFTDDVNRLRGIITQAEALRQEALREKYKNSQFGIPDLEKRRGNLFPQVDFYATSQTSNLDGVLGSLKRLRELQEKKRNNKDPNQINSLATAVTLAEQEFNRKLNQNGVVLDYMKFSAETYPEYERFVKPYLNFIEKSKNQSLPPPQSAAAVVTPVATATAAAVAANAVAPVKPPPPVKAKPIPKLGGRRR